MNPKKRAAVLMLAAVMLLPVFSGCSTKPPELDDVRTELIDLLERSYAVNDILFGAGLVTEYDLSGLSTEYTDEVKNAEGWYTDEQVFYNFYSPVVSSYLRDTDGDGVGDTETVQPTTVDGIKALCNGVYSTAFLNKYYTLIFSKGTLTSSGGSSAVKPRYRDSFVSDDVSFDEETGDTTKASESTVPALRKYIFIGENKINYIDPRGRTVYDYDTMRIIKPSDGDTLNVEIKGFYQKVTLDTSSEDTSDWHSVSEYVWENIVLCFVREADGWRLDTATY